MDFRKKNEVRISVTAAKFRTTKIQILLYQHSVSRKIGRLILVRSQHCLMSFRQQTTIKMSMTLALYFSPVLKLYTGFPWNPESEIQWISMTKLAIFHDHFRGQNSRTFSWEIHYCTISEIIISMIIFWKQIRVKFAIFHCYCGWHS